MAMLHGSAAPFSGAMLSYDTALKSALTGGWTMVTEGASGAQLKKAKVMSAADKWCIGIGVVGLVAGGLGVVLILIGVLDYAFFTKEQTGFLSRENPQWPPAEAKKKPAINLGRLALGLLIAIAALGAIMALATRS